MLDLNKFSEEDQEMIKEALDILKFDPNPELIIEKMLYHFEGDVSEVLYVVEDSDYRIVTKSELIEAEIEWRGIRVDIFQAMDYIMKDILWEDIKNTYFIYELEYDPGLEQLTYLQIYR